MRRCKSKGCQRWVPVHHGSPVLTMTAGKSCVALRGQIAALLCATTQVHGVRVPLLIDGVSDSIVTTIYNNWRQALTEYVVERQLGIKFGRTMPEPPGGGREIKVDEGMVRKQFGKGNSVVWHE